MKRCFAVLMIVACASVALAQEEEGTGAAKGAQVGIGFGFEDENPHRAAPVVVDDLVFVGGKVFHCNFTDAGIGCAVGYD